MKPKPNPKQAYRIFFPFLFLFFSFSLLSLLSLPDPSLPSLFQHRPHHLRPALGSLVDPRPSWTHAVDDPAQKWHQAMQTSPGFVVWASRPSTAASSRLVLASTRPSPPSSALHDVDPGRVTLYGAAEPALSLSLSCDLFFSRTMHRLGTTQACGHCTRPSHPWANVDQYPGSLDFCSSCVVHQKPTLSSKTHFASDDFHRHPWIPTANR